jgi:hypothetical protein
MLIHWPNLYAPRGKRRLGLREAQSRRTGQKKVKIGLVFTLRQKGG